MLHGDTMDNGFKFSIYYYLLYNVNEKPIHHGVLVGTTFRNVYVKAIKHHNNECGYRYIIGVLYSYNNVYIYTVSCSLCWVDCNRCCWVVVCDEVANEGGTQSLQKSHLNSILIYWSLVFLISEVTASVEMSHWTWGNLAFPESVTWRIIALKSLLDLAYRVEAAAVKE